MLLVLSTILFKLEWLYLKILLNTIITASARQDRIPSEKMWISGMKSSRRATRVGARGYHTYAKEWAFMAIVSGNTGRRKCVGVLGTLPAVSRLWLSVVDIALVLMLSPSRCMPGDVPDSDVGADGDQFLP